MKKFSLLFLLLCLVSCEATKKTVATAPVANATKNKKGNLIGVANRASFNQAPYNVWFQKNYNNYTIDKPTVTQLKKHLKGVTIKGFMGTWCGDSKYETPRFFKLLEETNFNQNKLELVTVNRSKRTPDNLQQGYNIIRVPTFIFYKDGKEIGRYVERPREVLEKDILKIVSGKPYKHSYQK